MEQRSNVLLTGIFGGRRSYRKRGGSPDFRLWIVSNGVYSIGVSIDIAQMHQQSTEGMNSHIRIGMRQQLTQRRARAVELLSWQLYQYPKKLHGVARRVQFVFRTFVLHARYGNPAPRARAASALSNALLAIPIRREYAALSATLNPGLLIAWFMSSINSLRPPTASRTSLRCWPPEGVPLSSETAPLRSDLVT